MSWLSLGFGIASQVLGAVGNAVSGTSSEESAPSSSQQAQSPEGAQPQTQQGQETSPSQGDRDLGQEFANFFRLTGPYYGHNSAATAIDLERFMGDDPELRRFFNENPRLFPNAGWALV